MKKLPFIDVDVRYVRYLSQQGWLLVGTFAAMIGSTLMGLVSPWPLKYIVDSVIGQQPLTDPFGQWFARWLGSNRQTQVIGFGLLMIAITAVSAMFDFFEAYL
ncbi:MAG TPA: hypothetical protein PKE45_11595, partial [Caldilineaceae bacterium]|nr:hypothetical protein [Caldilineaceae bacterium]